MDGDCKTCQGTGTTDDDEGSIVCFRCGGTGREY